MLKDSGNVEVDFDSSMINNKSFQKYKHESGKMYDIPEVHETRVKARFEIPEGKSLFVAGLKVLSKVEKTKRDPVIRRGVIDRFFGKKYVEKVVETMIIVIKPTVIVPEVVDDKAIRAYED